MDVFKPIQHLLFGTLWRIVCFASVLLASFVIAATHVSAADGHSTGGRLVTFYDRGQEKVILTHARTVRDALGDAGIAVTAKDVVEPKATSELVATDYVINIYRARPVIVVDGMVRQKVMTASQSNRAIVAAAGLEMRDEDKATLAASNNIAADGASVVLTVARATPFTLQLYGEPVQAYSHAATVGDMLKQKGIKLAATDSLSVSKGAPLASGMTIALWREGVQTATVKEPVRFPVRIIQDADQPIGYKKVQTPGVDGTKNVTYEIAARGGKETGRKAIQSVVIKQPVEQIEVIGVKPGAGSLTKSKGAQQWRDSKGVNHRETYYDLPMNIVMGACGGGSYTVRADGAKVDKDGYILVAAHLGNYPRCSLVETSMGLGKVYDTGGFTAKHPHGFDLATDWTKADGR